jgi:hypothetical protein
MGNPWSNDWLRTDPIYPFLLWMDGNPQLLIFCAADSSKKMVDLCPNDIEHMDAVAKW